jgi:hypothetical protein
MKQTTKEEKEKLTINKPEKSKIKKAKLYLQTKITKESTIKANLTSQEIVGRRPTSCQIQFRP